MTVNGIIKRTALSAYSSIRQSGIIALTLREGDRLAQVLVADADSHVLVATRRGMAILFPIHEVTEQGRTASGVRAIRLREDDRVADAEIVTETDPVAVVTEKGYGKRLDVAKFRHQHRGGMGLKISRGAEKIGAVVSLVKAGDTDDLTIITSKGVTNRVQANELRTMGRSAQGVIVMRLADDDTIVSAVVSPPRDVEGEQESG